MNKQASLIAFLDGFRFSLTRLLEAYKVPRSGCLHVGANFGQEAEVYDHLGFRKVVWVEGYAPYRARLLEAVGSRSNHTVVGLMVSDVEGEQMEFSVASNTGSSTVFEPTDAWRSTFKNLEMVDKETVVCGRLDRVLLAELDEATLNSLAFLVLDVEGSELKALRSMGRLIENVCFAFIEVSLREIFRNGPLLVDIDRFMLSHSFERIYIKTGAASGDALYRRVSSVGAVRKVWMFLSAYCLQLFATLRLTNAFVWFKQWVKQLTVQS